jgi:hypothetical protein
MRIFWSWGRDADGMRWSSIGAAVVVTAALLTPTVHAPPMSVSAHGAVVDGARTTPLPAPTAS